MAFSVPMIAPGHDNSEGLQRWDRLNYPCLFQGYGKFVLQDWHTSESRELGADRRFKRIGRAWASITFPILYEEDIKYILDTFNSGLEDGYVTVNVYNRDETRWMLANATLRLPDDTRNFNAELGWYENVVIELRDLIEIN